MSSPPAPGDRALLDRLDAIETEGRRVLQPRQEAWRRAVRTYQGRPEPSQNTAAPYPLFSVNLVRPIAERKAGLLTECEPEIEVRPRREGLRKTAEVLTQVIRAVWSEQHMQLVIESAALMVEVLNGAFVSITWDPDAAYGLGDIALAAIDPRHVLVDPGVRYARDIDSAQYVRLEGVVPLAIARAKFPAVADRLQASPDATLAAEGQPLGGTPSSGLRAAFERFTGSSAREGTEAVPRVLLQEYWLADDPEEYPGGRIVIRANGNVICTDEPNPYYDGRWPLEWLEGVPDMDSPYGSSEVEALRRLQDSYNRLGNLWNRVIAVNSMPLIVTDRGSLDTDAINTLRAKGYYILEQTPGRNFNRMPPPIPDGTQQAFMQFEQALMEYTAGLQDSGAPAPGRGRVELRSGAMLEGLQASQQVLIRSRARRLEALLERLGQKLISRVFQFYTSDRVMTLVGSDQQVRDYSFERQSLLRELLGLAVGALRQRRAQQDDPSKRAAELAGAGVAVLGRNTPVLPTGRPVDPVLGADAILAAIKGAWRDFRFRIVPFSTLGQNRMARMALVEHLVQQLALPRSMLTRTAGFDDPETLLNEAIQEQMQLQAHGIQSPQPPPGKGKKK